MKVKDDEYVKSIKKWGDDIDELIKAMRTQFNQMRADFAEQLSLIEKAFYDERNLILKRNDKEIQDLFDEHKEVEEKFLDQRSKNE